ncbi:hypothetical protein [Crocosphaera sp.]|nr:hypothetical protein [Crocosphaera sp.]
MSTISPNQFIVIIENVGRNPVLLGRLDILYDILELPKSENQAIGNAP